MSILVKGTDFGPTEQVTSTKLDNLVDAAKFTNTSETAVAYTGSTGTCLQGGGLEVTSAGQLQVSDSGINTVKLADSSSKTTGVTFAKMQHISTAKVLGNVSGSEGDVTEIDFKDEDDMSSDSATAVASQQSIKAYVDSITQKEALFYYNDSSVTTLNTDNTTFSQCPLTEFYNFISGASVSSNNVTLPAGTYIIDGSANIAITNNNENNGAINILEKTDGTDLLRGMDVSTDNDFSTNSTRNTKIMGSVAFSESTTIRWMFRRQGVGSRAVTLGRNLGQGAAPNAYLKITKIA